MTRLARRIARWLGLVQPEAPAKPWRVDREGVVYTDPRRVVLRAARP